MQIISCQPLEDCFDNSQTFGISFDTPIERALILRLGSAGELEFHPEFARPYFRMDIPGLLILKGIEGNQTARMTVNRSSLDRAIVELSGILSPEPTDVNTP